MMHMDAKATLTNDTDYSCHRTFLTNHIGSTSHHIMPLVINILGSRHMYTNTHTDVPTEVILKSSGVWTLPMQGVYS